MGLNKQLARKNPSTENAIFKFCATQTNHELIQLGENMLNRKDAERKDTDGWRPTKTHTHTSADA